MKSKLLKMGQASLVVGLCVLTSACNKTDEFFAIESFIEGADAYCSEATTAAACSERVGCQVALNGADDTNGDTSFGACIADPDYFPDTDGGAGGSDGSSDGGADGGTDGGAAGGTDGGASGGTDGGSVGGTDGGTAGGTDGGTDGSAAGGSAGGTDGGASGGSTGGSGDPDVPTIPEAYNANCTNVPAAYMYVKVTKSKKGTTYDKKVKVCHNTHNGDSHSIIIACPALQPHVSHHDDYLGACHP